MNKKDVLKLIIRLFSSLLAFFFVFGIIICIFIWFFQDKFIFFPSHDEDGYIELLNNSEFDEIKIDVDGQVLHGWLKRNTELEIAPLVIYYGGNAQNSSRTFSNYDDNNFFNYFSGYNLLYIDYPGYGLSDGVPSANNILKAGLDIYDYAYDLDYVDKDNIIILGFSLGTGVATYVSSLRDVNGLILLAPYDELRNMYNEQLNIFHGPLKNLIRQEINSKEYAKNVKTTTLIVASCDDHVVNYKYSLNLSGYFNNLEDAVITEGLGHNDFFQQEIVLENIYKYLQKRL